MLHEVLRQENPDSFASALPHARLLREIGRSRQAIERLEPVAARDPDPQRSLSLIAAWRKELNIHSGQDLAAVTPENPTSGPLPGQAASVPPPNRQGIWFGRAAWMRSLRSGRSTCGQSRTG